MARSKKSAQAAAPMMDHDYQAEDDHRTMMRAAEIHGDHKRMAGVHRHHKKQIEALGKVHTMLKGGAGRSMSKGKR